MLTSTLGNSKVLADALAPAAGKAADAGAAAVAAERNEVGVPPFALAYGKASRFGVGSTSPGIPSAVAEHDGGASTMAAVFVSSTCGIASGFSTLGEPGPVVEPEHTVESDSRDRPRDVRAEGNIVSNTSVVAKTAKAEGGAAPTSLCMLLLRRDGDPRMLRATFEVDPLLLRLLALPPRTSFKCGGPSEGTEEELRLVRECWRSLAWRRRRRPCAAPTPRPAPPLAWVVGVVAAVMRVVLGGGAGGHGRVSIAEAGRSGERGVSCADALTATETAAVAAGAGTGAATALIGVRNDVVGRAVALRDSIRCCGRTRVRAAVALPPAALECVGNVAFVAASVGVKALLLLPPAAAASSPERLLAWPVVRTLVRLARAIARAVRITGGCGIALMLLLVNDAAVPFLLYKASNERALRSALVVLLDMSRDDGGAVSATLRQLRWEKSDVDPLMLLRDTVGSSTPVKRVLFALVVAAAPARVRLPSLLLYILTLTEEAPTPVGNSSTSARFAPPLASSCTADRPPGDRGTAVALTRWCCCCPSRLPRRAGGSEVRAGPSSGASVPFSGARLLGCVRSFSVEGNSAASPAVERDGEVLANASDVAGLRHALNGATPAVDAVAALPAAPCALRWGEKEEPLALLRGPPAPSDVTEEEESSETARLECRRTGCSVTGF